MTTIKLLTEAEHSSYDNYLGQNAEATPYHSRAWWEVLRRAYGYQPAPLIAVDENGSVKGVLPLMRVHGRLKGWRLVGLPFSHCVPLLAANADVEKVLLDAAIRMTNEEGYSYLELKTRRPVQHEAFQPSTLNHISELDLRPEIEALWEAFSQSNRRNIRKADKAGLAVRRGETSADFDAFYQLEVSTRHRQGAPIYPASFFHHVYGLMGEQVRLYMVSLDGRDVAGLVILQAGQRAIYAYGGSVRDEGVNRLRPNNWLMWHAIQQARADGCTIFDFGTTPMHHENLLAFKNHFRPQHEELPYWYYLNTRQSVPVIKRDSRSVKFMETVLWMLPRPLFTRLSPLLLREVG